MTIAHQEDQLKQEPLERLLWKIVAFLSGYIRTLRRIPTDSRWYPLIPEHKALYLTNDSAVGIATTTSTLIQPEMKPDPRWVEKSLLDLEFESLNQCLNDQRYIIGLRAITHFEQIFTALGEAWMIQDSQEPLHKLYREVITFAERQSVSLLSNDLENEELSSLDYISLFPINSLIAFFNNLETINLASVCKTLALLKWDRINSIYTLNLPTAVLERLEYIRKSLAFEKRTEGKIISPAWYYTQLVIQPLGFALKTQIDTLVAISSDFYLNKSKELIKTQKVTQALVVIFRGLEFLNKAFAHFPLAEGFSKELDSMQKIDKLSWPNWNWLQTYEALQKTRDSLIECLAQCIPAYSTSEWNKDIPDYFGNAVHTVGEECFNALLSNKSNLFDSIFPSYFIGALVTVEKLQSQTAGWQYQEAAITSPIMDLLELSGYAILFAELHQSPSLQEACFQQWDKYLQPSMRRKRLEWFSAVISYNRGLYAITPRSVIRTNWKIKFDKLLRDFPRKSPPNRLNLRSLAFMDVQIIDHPSTLIRVMGGQSNNYLAFFDGLDVFADLYLAKLAETEGIRIGLRDRVSDAIEQSRRYQNEDGFESVDDFEE